MCLRLPKGPFILGFLSFLFFGPGVQIAELAMIPLAEARQLLCRMLLEEYVHLQVRGTPASGLTPEAYSAQREASL